MGRPSSLVKENDEGLVVFASDMITIEKLDGNWLFRVVRALRENATRQLG